MESRSFVHQEVRGGVEAVRVKGYRERVLMQTGEEVGMTDPIKPGLVLLAAGRGSRLSELTDKTHKSLLSVAGRPALGRIIAELAEGDFSEVVLVTGYKAEDVAEFALDEHAGFINHIAFNSQWEEDTNILSTEIGVSRLLNPECGYLVVETDIALDPNSWRRIRSTAGGCDSIWYTRGRYSRDLTGGCLNTDDEGFVNQLVYAPDYDEMYEGWHKLLGVLYVSPGQVALDRKLRKAAIGVSTHQYYLQPYIDHRLDLPCKSVDLGDGLALSFNDLAAYQDANDSFTRTGE